jgi:hypothetical protein
LSLALSALIAHFSLPAFIGLRGVLLESSPQCLWIGALEAVHIREGLDIGNATSVGAVQREGGEASRSAGDVRRGESVGVVRSVPSSGCL